MFTYIGSTLIILNLTLVTVYKLPASMTPLCLQGAFQCQQRFDSTTAYYSATEFKSVRNAAAAACCVAGPGSHLLL